MYDLPALLADDQAVAALVKAVREESPVQQLRDAKIKLTGQCNLRCSFCRCWRTDAGAELTRDELLPVLDDLAGLDCRKIHFTGGEPTLRPDLAELIAHAAQAGMRTAITSNGTLITAELATALVGAGLVGITISLDAPNAELHDTIRGVKGTFKAAVAGIKNLRRARKASGTRLKIRVNTVLTRHNYHLYPELLALVGELGVDDVTALPVDEGSSNRNRLSAWQLEEFNEDIVPSANELRTKFGFSMGQEAQYPFGTVRPEMKQAASVEYARGFYHEHLCFAPWLTTLITWRGDVFPCCMTRDKIPPLGNLREQSFHEIFTGTAYTVFRHTFLQQRLPICHRCDNYLAENILLDRSMVNE
ncbi:MAG: radical SAM protein [bacterium]